jgi:hypothetical protein
MSNHGNSKHTGAGMPLSIEQALATTIHNKYNTEYNTPRGALPAPTFTTDTHSVEKNTGRRRLKAPSAILVDGPAMIAKIINSVTVASDAYLDAHSGSALQMAARYQGHVKWVVKWGTLDTEAQWKLIKKKATGSKLVSV